jgi:SAM-dependent methyltransferase
MRIKQWCRVVMNEATEDLLRKLGPEQLDILEISGDAWSDIGARSYRSIGYPIFDICKEILTEKFDLIIAEQVFEHLRHPWIAARNVYRMLRNGGYFLITTPFLIRIHSEPIDLWRWTPEGLKAFLEDAGFDAIVVDAWGNRECVIGNFDAWAWFDPQNHSLRSEPDLPLVVWALARRSH